MSITDLLKLGFGISFDPVIHQLGDSEYISIDVKLFRSGNFVSERIDSRDWKQSSGYLSESLLLSLFKEHNKAFPRDCIRIF